MLFTVNCTLNQERHLRIPAKVKSLKKRKTYILIERRRIIAVLCRSPRIKHYFWASAQSYRYNDQVVFKMQSNSISYQFPQSVLLLICGVTLLWWNKSWHYTSSKGRICQSVIKLFLTTSYTYRVSHKRRPIAKIW